MNKLQSQIETLETGDLILFSSKQSGGFMSYLSSLIKWGTHSNYTHIAMILKDPEFVNPRLKGYYVWESGWENKKDPQDNKIKLGVQITPLQVIIDNYKSDGSVFIRKLDITIDIRNELLSKEKLKKIHDVVYMKPYDIILSDWIKALIQKNNRPQNTDRFWCSALVGYIYTKCGILKEETDWTIIRPCDFSLDGQDLKYNNKTIKLENIEKKLN